MRLTKTKIDALEHNGKNRDVHWDDLVSGFGVRVYPTGKKSFVLSYRVHGRKRLITLGSYGVLTIDTARKKARATLVQITNGDDPLKARSKATGALTIKDLADEFMDRYITKQRKCPEHVGYILNADILPYWKSRKAFDITRRDVVVLLDRVVDRGAKIQANRVASVLIQMFRFAVERDILETSPCIYLRKPGGKENIRTRVLDDEEIRLFWANLDKTPMTRGINLALKLLLVTGQRRGEIAHAEWPEIDIDKEIWSIPAEKTKNGHAHIVPLSPLAISLFRELKTLSQYSDYVVPSPVGLERPITDRAITRAVSRYQPIFGIEKFVTHDLRRTLATHMRRMGIPASHVDKVQNHLEQGIIRHYDHHNYLREKRRALDRWARHLEKVISGKSDNVIPLPR